MGVSVARRSSGTSRFGSYSSGTGLREFDPGALLGWMTPGELRLFSHEEVDEAKAWVAG
jgi:hypothetical protein